MTFKEIAARDIHNVFLNPAELAEERTVRYDGEEYPGIPVSLGCRFWSARCCRGPLR